MMNKELKEELYKTITAGISPAMIQEVVDKVVASIFFSENPLRQNLNVVQGQGQAYVFNRRTSSSSAWGSAIGDTESFTEADGTYTKVSLPYKIYGTTVKVTRFARAITANYVDILEQELSDRIREFREWEQRAIIFGAYVTPFSTSPTQKFAAGLLAQIIKEDGNYLDCEETLTLAKLDQAIDMCYSSPSMIVCSRGGRRKLQALLQSQQRFVNEVEIKGGFRVMEYAGLPVLTTSAIPDTIQFDMNNSQKNFITSLTGGNKSLMLILNLNDTFIAELQSLTTQELASTSSQYVQYDVFEYITPVVKIPQNNCVVLNF